jgi:sarcosine oxidase subunit gamma
VVDHARAASALGPAGPALPSFGAGTEVALDIREIAHRRIVEVGHARATPQLDAVLGLFGSKRLPDVGEIRVADGLFLLGTGAKRWLLVTSGEDASAEVRALTNVDDAFEIALEAGDGWTQFAISGSAALDLLAKGCALDLHPRVFTESVCATTRFAQIRCVLFRAGRSYRLLVGRSYAVSMAEWLVEAAEEFGSAVEKKAPDEAPSSETRP